MSRPSLYPDTREHILATGEALIHGRSFTALGLSELLSSAGVPKGSFYHYFKSKEDFGVALIQRYFAGYRERLDLLFGNAAVGDGRSRLIAYFAQWQPCSSGQGCLAVKLAAEVADLSEPMRETMAEGTRAIVQRLAAVLTAGQQDGSIDPGLPADDTAAALYSLWLGTALLYKVRHDPALMDMAMRHTESLLAPCRQP